MLLLTMEFLPGHTLAERIKERGPMTVEKALPLVRHMAAALAAAHERKVAHLLLIKALSLGVFSDGLTATPTSGLWQWQQLERRIWVVPASEVRTAKIAERMFATVAALIPDATLGHENQGALALLLGRYDEAEKALRRAIRIQPSPAAYSNLGFCFFLWRRYATAVPWFEKATELQPKDDKLWRNSGDAYNRVPRWPINPPWRTARRSRWRSSTWL